MIFNYVFLSKLYFCTENKSNMEFKYQDPYPILKDDTVYKKLTSDYVKVEQAW